MHMNVCAYAREKERERGELTLIHTKVLQICHVIPLNIFTKLLQMAGESEGAF